jgi:hypothetical protein
MRSIFRGPDGTLRDGWRAVLFLPGAWACGGLAGALRPALPEALAPWFPAPWWFFLGFLFLTWVCLQLERRPLSSVGLEPGRRWAREFLLGVLGGTGLIALMALGALLAGGCHWVRNPQVGLARVGAAAWLYLAVAAEEELLFRGYLFQRLARGLGPWAAQPLVAALFVGLHWGNPGMAGATRAWAGLNLFLAGVLLGFCYLRTRSLALPVGVHLGWNWTQGALLGVGVSGLPAAGWWKPVYQGGPVWITGGAFGLEASLPCTVVALGACLALARSHHARRSEWLII